MFPALFYIIDSLQMRKRKAASSATSSNTPARDSMWRQFRVAWISMESGARLLAFKPGFAMAKLDDLGQLT